MNWFELGYLVLGGLAMFFYGMKMLSDSLQSVSSAFIRKVIGSLTNNRFIAVIVGLTVTCLVQSSSITTVMVVGFVNAGLMQLSQAIGVIFGANIGTTITGWIISIKVGKYGFVLLALGILPIIFLKNSKYSPYGRVLFALGLIFIGLETMSNAFKPLRTNQDFIELMTYFAADHYFSIIATVAIGCLLTFVIQSSSAMLGITIALASTGSITFQTAAALVMGENIGTTITAILAGVGSNINGKRAALAHTIFNVAGVIVMIIVFPIYVEFIEWLIVSPADYIAPDGSKPNVALHIAASHTVFNVANVIIFILFLPQFSRLIEWLIPIKKKQEKHLEFLGTAMTLSPALAIVQARKALLKMAGMVDHMIGWTKSYVCVEPSDKIRHNILKYEDVTDHIHQEVMIFVGHIMQRGVNSEEASQVHAILSISDELESLADYCQKIITQLKHTEKPVEDLSAESLKLIEELMSITETYFKVVYKALQEEKAIDLKRLESIRDEFNEKARLAKDKQMKSVRDGDASPFSCLTVNDLINALARIVSHSRKVAEADAGKNQVWVY